MVYKAPNPSQIKRHTELVGVGYHTSRRVLTAKALLEANATAESIEDLKEIIDALIRYTLE